MEREAGNLKMSASLEELAGAKEKELNQLRLQQAQLTRETVKSES